MRRWLKTERRERFGAYSEPRTDHDDLGGDAFLAGQFDRSDMAVGSGDDPGHNPAPGTHAAGCQGFELRAVHLDMVVEHNGEVGCELAEQPGSVEPQRVGNDLDDAPVADLEAVAERAVDDVAPPVLCQALDVGELVYQPGSGKNSTSNDGVTADQFDAE